MKRRNEQQFESMRVVGGLINSQVLRDVRKFSLSGQTVSDYGVEKGLKLSDELGRYWRIARTRWQEYTAQQPRSDIDQNHLAVDDWLLPLLSKVLGYEIKPATPRQIGERIFPVTHFACNNHLPLVLCGARFDLDKGHEAFGQEGRKRSPSGLAQEYLNAENNCLWAIVSNGLTLRLLRDNPAMTRPAYLEVDFARLFDEDNFADFSTLWLLLHVSRIAPQNDNTAECWLEQWRNQGLNAGERALDSLRYGVADALRVLGSGFVAHSGNTSLREKITAGELTTDAYFQQVLRLVYRLLFLFTSEDRQLALLPGDEYKAARELYLQGYSLSQLRERSRQRRHYDHHGDAWQQLLITFAGYAQGQETLAQPALGGLFADDQCPDLASAELENRHLFEAIFKLGFFESKGILSRINYRDMDTEEFGSVYESLLELIPQLHTEGQWHFNFMGDEEDEKAVGGHTRKLTGSYYTPDSLVQELIKSALVPVIEDRLKSNPVNPRDALLSITVCDPACGSGHFLLAAARRLATELAQIDAGLDQPTEDDYRRALREVISHCIFGVDRNPMALELCRTALWLESLESSTAARPLSFLDHHLQCGDSLLGLVDFEAFKYGISKDAYKALSGDDKEVCKQLAKDNKKGLQQIERDFSHGQSLMRFEDVEGLTELKALEELPENSLDDIDARTRAYESFTAHTARDSKAHAANLIVGAYLLPKTEESAIAIPTSETVYLELFNEQHNDDHKLKLHSSTEVCRKAHVFHWPLAYPQIFEKGGFDCILGNPPWERIKLQEEEFFASRYPLIVEAKNKAERAKRIDWLSQGRLVQNLFPDQPESGFVSSAEKKLYSEFITTRREAEAVSAFAHVKAKEAGRYPLTGVGDVNTYALFSETIRSILSPTGRAGFIVPSGLATDNTTKAFFGDLVSKKSLESFFEFENEGFFSGAGQGHMLRFALTTIVGADQQIPETRYMFQGKKLEYLSDPERVFTLSAEDIGRVNPNTLTCPIFQSRYDAELTKNIYKKVPVLIREAQISQHEQNPWGIQFMAMFHMANDSHMFRTSQQLLVDGYTLEGNQFVHGRDRFVPLYEAKMIHQYNHRHGDFSSTNGQRAHVLPSISMEKLKNPNYLPIPFYWISSKNVDDALEHKYWDRSWIIGWRDVTDARASSRTLIPSVIPRCGVNDKYLLMLPKASPRLCSALLGNLCSLVCDYVAKQKVGGLAFKYFTMKQMPIISPEVYSDSDLNFISKRVLELTYTSCDMKGWARDLGYEGRPFEFSSDRRHQLKAELDAYYAMLYGLSRDELRFILDPQEVRPSYPSETFSALKRGEVKTYGEYRTQRLTLEAWDRLKQGDLL